MPLGMSTLTLSISSRREIASSSPERQLPRMQQFSKQGLISSCLTIVCSVSPYGPVRGRLTRERLQRSPEVEILMRSASLLIAIEVAILAMATIASAQTAVPAREQSFPAKPHRCERSIKAGSLAVISRTRSKKCSGKVLRILAQSRKPDREIAFAISLAGFRKASDRGGAEADIASKRK